MNYARLITLIALLTGSVRTVSGQNIPFSTTNEAELSRRWVAKFAPLSLLDPDNTIQFGVERLMSRHNAVQLELGYGWQGMNTWRHSQNERYPNRETWRARAEWRYYFQPTSQPLGRYVAVEGFYKQINARESGTVGMECQTGNCQYYQLYSAPIQKYVWGGHVKFGRQFLIIPDNNRLLADLYAGLGVRWRTVERYRPPSDSYYYEPAGYFITDTFSATPYVITSVSLGFKIGYSF